MVLPVIVYSLHPIVEVIVSHIVNIGEFYVQPADQQVKIKELTELLASQSSPVQLNSDDLKEG